jgi:dolichol-phosphate mannosyltransferase
MDVPLTKQMRHSDSKPLISLVVPCYNEAEVFPYLRAELAGVADRLGGEFCVEIILVDDGSSDSTWEHIRRFANDDCRVRGMALSRNFGHQMALTCGCDHAQGDAVVCMDADLQDPPEVVLELVERWKEGYDVVFAVRKHREGESRFKLWTAALFYRMIWLLGASHVKPDTGDFRLMSRLSLDALQQMREEHRFVRGMVGWVGYRTSDVYYCRKARRAGETKYPFKKMLHFAVDAIVSFSTIPLKVSFVAAVLLSALILGYLALAAGNHFFFGAVLVPGWSSLILAIVALGGMNLICVGILGEYVGRIYEQVKQRPLYLVQTTTSESCSANKTGSLTIANHNEPSVAAVRESGRSAEFDGYAASYDAGMDNPLRRCLGGDSESFIEVKADWLLRQSGGFPEEGGGKSIRLLDYGCGTGALLRVLRRREVRGSLAGCDVSSEMLREAARLWQQGPLPTLHAMNDMLAPFDDEEFDIVVVSSVLHHVVPEQRARTYADIMRLVKPGGHVYVFEHNPYNPVTQWVVRRTPIDKNAALLRSAEVHTGLEKAGASGLETHYIMFSPPRLKFCRPLDRALSWLPLGAQYVVSARGVGSAIVPKHRAA